MLMCSGRPWIDVAAATARSATAATTTPARSRRRSTPPSPTTGRCIFRPAPTRSRAKITIDYAGQASERVSPDLRGRDDRRAHHRLGAGAAGANARAARPSSPTGCFYFKEEGTLFVNAEHAGLCGGDRQDAISPTRTTRRKSTTWSSTTPAPRPAPAGCSSTTCSTATSTRLPIAAGGGGRVGARADAVLAHFRRRHRRRRPAARRCCSRTGYNYRQHDLRLRHGGVADLPRRSPSTHDGMNTFISPYFDCTTAVNATASTHNLLINPNYAGNVVNRGAAIDRHPDRRHRQLGAAGSFRRRRPIPRRRSTRGTALSIFNAPGASLAVTLPAPARGRPPAGRWVLPPTTARA